MDVAVMALALPGKLVAVLALPFAGVIATWFLVRLLRNGIKLRVTLLEMQANLSAGSRVVSALVQTANDRASNVAEKGRELQDSVAQARSSGRRLAALGEVVREDRRRLTDSLLEALLGPPGDPSPTPEPEPEPESDAEPTSNPEPGSDAEPGSDVEGEPDPVPEPEPAAVAEAEPEREPSGERTPRPAREPDAVPAADAGPQGPVQAEPAPPQYDSRLEPITKLRITQLDENGAVDA